MGLDMYLRIKKRDYGEKPVVEIGNKELEEVYKANATSSRKDTVWTIETKTYDIMYWRKANAIHKWFVDECGEGVDECQDIEVPWEKLWELETKCLRALADKEHAADELPTTDGFFFGGTDYDDWYFDDVKATADFIMSMRNAVGKDPSIKEDYELIYKASW